MSSRVKRAIPFGKKVINEFQAENVTFMAGSIAYQAFVSLLPLLILLFFVVSAVGDQALASRITTLTQSFLPPSARTLLGNAISGNVGGAGASIIGVVTLLWGSLKIFRGLDTAFSDIYDTESENSFTDQITDGLVVFVTLLLAIVASGAATTIFAYFQEIPFVGLLSPLLLVVSLVIAFSPIYYFFPDIDVSLREVLPGVVIAAIGWTLLQSLFQVYVSFSDKTAAYGILGAILILLTWLYFGGLILLLGAVVNAVIAGRTGDRSTSTEDTTGSAAAVHREADSKDGDFQRIQNEINRKSFAIILQDIGHEFEETNGLTVQLGTETKTLHPPEEIDVTLEAGEVPTSNSTLADNEGITIRAQWRRKPSDEES